MLQDSVRIRAEFLPEPFDPRLVVESEADDRHPLHIGNAGLLARITKTLPDHALAVHEHAVHIKDHRIHMHTSRIHLHAPEYNAPGKKKQAPPCADRGKRQPPRPIDRSGCEFLHHDWDSVSLTLPSFRTPSPHSPAAGGWAGAAGRRTRTCRTSHSPRPYDRAVRRRHCSNNPYASRGRSASRSS